MFRGIDRVAKFIFVEIHPRTTMMTGAAFLRGVGAAFLYAVHTVLTDIAVAFTTARRRSSTTASTCPTASAACTGSRTSSREPVIR
jgi:hypothetical protein